MDTIQSEMETDEFCDGYSQDDFDALLGSSHFSSGVSGEVAERMTSKRRPEE